MSERPDLYDLLKLVNRTLWVEWDPITGNAAENMKVPEDEYLSYAAHLTSYIWNGTASVERVLDYLKEIEGENIGLVGGRSQPVAMKLAALNWSR